LKTTASSRSIPSSIANDICLPNLRGYSIMRKVQVLLMSTAVILLSPFVADAARVESRSGCVNLREEPSTTSEVIACLRSGTYVEPIRLPPTGRFVWVEDQVNRDLTWWKVSVPSMNVEGWMVSDYINLDAN
jgi:hypothetical protein